ncbi:hypothetical protein EWM64_g7932 [Hericium alpestre]|uniref:Uncharacterized protein n=1 Tax=Hericium alpestre TaxID=135208 RepID=A0A4Y9ZP94_9AGAM|nr:hypothetical protein EWM64_g7932 [Hericium alpestre]
MSFAFNAKAKPSAKASTSHGVKKTASAAPRPAFTVYRDKPAPEDAKYALATKRRVFPANENVKPFKPGEDGRYSPTLFTKRGLRSARASIESGHMHNIPATELPPAKVMLTPVAKKPKTRRSLNPRTPGDDFDVDMMDIEGMSPDSTFSSWGSSRKSVMSTPPKRKSGESSQPPSSPLEWKGIGEPSPLSPVGAFMSIDSGPSPNMFDDEEN